MSESASVGRWRLEHDFWWWEESGVDAQGRICLGAMDHPGRWLPRVPLPPFRIRFPDKVSHALATALFSLWLGPLWGFLLMTIGVEIVVSVFYDWKADVRIGIWDTLANGVGACGVALLF